MKSDETQLGTMLHALQERAKELNCLYQVGELLSQSKRPLEEIFRGIIEILPPGWQYPHDCQARILFENMTIQPPDFQATRWVQKADIVVQGAEPLFFLDYFATGKLDPDRQAAVVAGIAEGCRQSGCALIGGETAEMPGFYARGEYDLAGFAVGCVERSRILDGRGVEPGDAVLGIASTGLHSNGYSLARRALLDRHPLDWRPPGLGGRTLGEALLESTRIYAKDVLALVEAVKVKSLSHITGGGLPGNVPRILPRLVKLPRADSQQDYVHSGRLIGHYLADLFPGTTANRVQHRISVPVLLLRGHMAAARARLRCEQALPPTPR